MGKERESRENPPSNYRLIRLTSFWTPIFTTSFIFSWIKLIFEKVMNFWRNARSAISHGETKWETSSCLHCIFRSIIKYLTACQINSCGIRGILGMCPAAFPGFEAQVLSMAIISAAFAATLHSCHSSRIHLLFRSQMNWLVEIDWAILFYPRADLDAVVRLSNCHQAYEATVVSVCLLGVFHQLRRCCC